MFLIDLNQCYGGVVNGGKIWTHELDDAPRQRGEQWLVPDDDPVHVRKGREVALMPLSAVHQWLFPFGPFDINSDAFPEEYIDSVVKRREPAAPPTGKVWTTGIHQMTDQAASMNCDGTCEQCTFPQLGLRQIAFMRNHMKPLPLVATTKRATTSAQKTFLSAPFWLS